ncbi:MAG: hypothetical protein RLZZ607_1136 [Pseudomonadota bacterium]
MRTLVIAGLMLALCAVGSAHAACTPGSLDLRWPGGQAHFTVEVAADQAAREKGLMFREHMASSAGMIFVYQAPIHARFWMKNTLIPLDMIFADETGLVTVVHSDAIPQDLTPIDGGEGVMYVLEINGGLAKRIGIAAGAEMRFDLIDPSKALWSCAD